MVLRVVARFEGFEGHKVRNAEKKNKMVRVEEKSMNCKLRQGGEQPVVEEASDGTSTLL